MTRLIDADALIRKLHERLCKIDNGRSHAGMSIPVVDGVRMDELVFCIDTIDCEPIIEAEPVRHGWWIDGADSFGATRKTYRVCSHCNICIPYVKEVPDLYWQSCPNCRTKMDGGE